jgi:hypothetical protein
MINFTRHSILHRDWICDFNICFLQLIPIVTINISTVIRDQFSIACWQVLMVLYFTIVIPWYIAFNSDAQGVFDVIDDVFTYDFVYMSYQKWVLLNRIGRAFLLQICVIFFQKNSRWLFVADFIIMFITGAKDKYGHMHYDLRFIAKVCGNLSLSHSVSLSLTLSLCQYLC